MDHLDPTTTTEPTRIEKMRIAAQVLRPLLERQRTAWEALGFFEGTPRNEVAFWGRFSAMSAEDRAFLAGFYETQTAWQLFCRICLFWSVRISESRPDYGGAGNELTSAPKGATK